MRHAKIEKVAPRTDAVRELCAQRKAARAINYAQVARNLGVHYSTIYHTLAGKPYFSSPRVRRGIAQALGLRVRDLWPPPAPADAGNGAANGL